jgi:uncharacterized membrane protein YdjX (TVP38/TMEM64 family)
VERSDSRPPLAAIGVTLAGIALLAGLVAAVPELHRAFDAAVHGDSAEVRDQIESLGVAGPLLIVALAVVHGVVFYPAEIIDAAAGFVYGFGPGLALMTVAWLLSGLLSYAIGRSVARPLLDRWFGAARFARAEARVERGGAALLIAVRLIPILPFSLMCYAMGAARVPLWRFTWTTALGYLPITALAVYFGTRLEGLSLTDPLVLGSALALLALLAVGHLVASRQSGAQPDEPTRRTRKR